MKKMWAGRTAGELNKIADKFNASIPFDQRLYRQDITGSIMHAEMLAAKGIIPAAAKDHIIEGLEGILEDLESGKLEVDLTAEDVHMFVEGALTERIGAEGKMLHTARSRNDQVALDLRMYVKEEIEELQHLVLEMMCISGPTYPRLGAALLQVPLTRRIAGWKQKVLDSIPSV